MYRLRMAILLGALAVLASSSFAVERAGPLSAKPEASENPLGLIFQPLGPVQSRGSLQALPTIVYSQSSCYVSINCEDGTTRSCTDTTSPFSCLGEHQNCSAGTQGYVRCNGGTPNYCPVCEVQCQATVQCSTLNGQSCSPNGLEKDCLFGSMCINNGCLCEEGNWMCIE